MRVPQKVTCSFLYFLSIQVTVGCIGEDRYTPCEKLVLPSGICSDGSNINTVRFTYTGFDCIDGDGYDTCSDSNGGPPADTEAIVICVDGGTTLASETVVPGDIITVSQVGGLTDIITCTVEGADGTLYQTITINTSGDVNLHLGEKFGSLQLQACDDQDCIESVTWYYTFENIGSTPMTITVADRTRNDITDSLRDQLPTLQLDIGQSAGISETQKVGMCVDNVITTNIDVHATAPDATICEGKGLYTFITGLPPSLVITPSPSPPPTLPPTIVTASPSVFATPSTPEPTDPPTLSPSIAGTDLPTKAPTVAPTERPTTPPVTAEPTDPPTLSPSIAGTDLPTKAPTVAPTERPTTPPVTAEPTNFPTLAPSVAGTDAPTQSPTIPPTKSPTEAPVTPEPTVVPTMGPSASPAPSDGFDV